MQTADPEEEAQAIALLAREAIDVPERRVAIVTPDRGLANRIAHHLRRWRIQVDDTAGTPLSRTAAGRAFLLLAEMMDGQTDPVGLMGLLSHPLAGAGHERREWLAHVRKLELALRGPRPEPGLHSVRASVEKLASERKDEAILAWWSSVEAILTSLVSGDSAIPDMLAEMLDRLTAAGEELCGEALWAQEDGRALSAFVEDFRAKARMAGTQLEPRHVAAILRDAMEEVAVRPPYGGHPRIGLYGLLESRMTRADLVICAGLNEGVWPAATGADPLLAPAIMRAIGVPGAEFRMGLAAHDLAGALGAPEVVLSRSARDADGPAIPSRFLLRVQALLGELADDRTERQMPRLARLIDRTAEQPEPYRRPRPCPTAKQRNVSIAVTALDRLRGDPYQFYAGSILGLRALDQLDAEPTPAWQGNLAHRILERWHQAGADGLHTDIGAIADDVLREMQSHPLTRALWRPRLMAALDWVVDAIERSPDREPIAWECKGEMIVGGVRVHGRADRIDRLPDGGLAIVDYKTGKPPKPAQVEAGYALQLGLLGMIGANGGFDDHAQGNPTAFEYWSLGRKNGSFGYVETPLRVGKKKSGFEPDAFLPSNGAVPARGDLGLDYKEPDPSLRN